MLRAFFAPGCRHGGVLYVWHCSVMLENGMHRMFWLDGLEKLEYRGYDSAGVALTQRDGIRVVKSKGRLSTLRSKLEELALPQSSCGHRSYPLGDPRRAQRCEQPPAFHAPGEHRPQRHHRKLWCAEGEAHGQGLYL